MSGDVTFVRSWNLPDPLLLGKSEEGSIPFIHEIDLIKKICRQRLSRTLGTPHVTHRDNQGPAASPSVRLSALRPIVQKALRGLRQKSVDRIDAKQWSGEKESLNHRSSVVNDAFQPSRQDAPDLDNNEQSAIKRHQPLDPAGNEPMQPTPQSDKLASAPCSQAPPNPNACRITVEDEERPIAKLQLLSVGKGDTAVLDSIVMNSLVTESLSRSSEIDGERRSAGMNPAFPSAPPGGSDRPSSVGSHDALLCNAEACSNAGTGASVQADSSSNALSAVLPHCKSTHLAEVGGSGEGFKNTNSKSVSPPDTCNASSEVWETPSRTPADRSTLVTSDLPLDVPQQNFCEPMDMDIPPLHPAGRALLCGSGKQGSSQQPVEQSDKQEIIMQPGPTLRRSDLVGTPVLGEDDAPSLLPDMPSGGDVDAVLATPFDVVLATPMASLPLSCGSPPRMDGTVPMMGLMSTADAARKLPVTIDDDFHPREAQMPFTSRSSNISSPDGDGWELHLPGTAEAVFACSSGRTIACLVLKPRDEAGAEEGPGSRCDGCAQGESSLLTKSDVTLQPEVLRSSPWELLVMETGFIPSHGADRGAAAGIEPCPVGKLPLIPQHGTESLGLRPGQLDLSSTLSLIDVSTSTSRDVNQGPLGMADTSYQNSVCTVMLVACGAWSVEGWEEELQHPIMMEQGQLEATEGGPHIPQQGCISSRGQRHHSCVDIFTLSHDEDGDLNLARRLSAETLMVARCVLAIENLGIVIAAGSHGLAHAWHLAADESGGKQSCSWQLSQWAEGSMAEESWELPSSSSVSGERGYDVVELRLASHTMSEEGGIMPMPQDSTSGPSGPGSCGRYGKCLILGRCSDGSVFVWDVFSRQLLAKICPPQSSSVFSIKGIHPLPPLPNMANSGATDKGHPWSSQPLLALASIKTVDTFEFRHCLLGQENGSLPAVKHSDRKSKDCLSLSLMVIYGGGHAEFLPGPDLSCLLGSVATTMPLSISPLEPLSISCLAVLNELVAIGSSSGQVVLWDAVGGRMVSVLDCGRHRGTHNSTDVVKSIEMVKLEADGSCSGGIVVVAGIGQMMLVSRSLSSVGIGLCPFTPFV